MLYLLSLSAALSSFFFFYSSGDLRDLHSFPTRRSSDLRPVGRGPRTARPRSRTPCSGRTGRRRRRRWPAPPPPPPGDRKSTRLNSSHQIISYAVFCLKKKKNNEKVISYKGPKHTR